MARMLIASILACCTILPAASAASETEPDDDRVRKAWEFLLPAEQDEACQWFAAEASALNTYQNRLIQSVKAIVDRDPGTFPEADEEVFFDPQEHSPGQVIRRKWVDSDDAGWKRVHKRFFKAVPERRLQRAWRYEYGARRVVRVADDLAPEHIAANALQGFAPDLDFAEALVESLLDDGAQRLALGALEHTYTDRKGRAYRGITLYDGWASGTEMEMPDVDTLGVVHTVLDDWDRWVAPVAASKHDTLYEAVGAIFVDAHRHRALRSALARVYAIGEPVLRDAYGPHRDRFHALWFEHEEDPRKLAQALPSSAGWQDFLGETTLRVEKDAALIGAARERRTILEEDARRVRALWVHVLTELGAFERTRRPRPPPERKSSDDKSK